MANKSIMCQILHGFRNIHIFSVSETHLSLESEAEVQIEGYTFIASGQGGGVGVYISSFITFQRRMDLEQGNIECIWIEILFPKTKGFLVDIIYRPADSTKHLCIDFNCKHLNQCFRRCQLKTNNVFSQVTFNVTFYCPQITEIKSILASFGLKQLITSLTRITCESNPILDDICSNKPYNIYSGKVTPAGLSDHWMCSQAEQC